MTRFHPHHLLSLVCTVCVVCLACIVFPALAEEHVQGNLTSAPNTSAPYTFAPHTFETASGETVDAEWGTFQVPEDRSVEGGKTLTLAFVRFPTTAEKPGPPIVYLAGGPGGSGIRTARGSRFSLFQALRKFGDVIAFDQRGTGDSEPQLLCAAPKVPVGRASTRAELTVQAQDAARTCAAKIAGEGFRLSAYNTVESADDLNDLRRVLGAEKITLWGISYGTHLALATLKRHGAQIDRVVLAGLEGLDQTLKLPSDQQELLQTIAALAAADPQVRAAMPDLMDSIRRVAARLENEPSTVSIADPSGGEPVPVSVGRLDFQMALAGMLRGPESFAGLPDFVARLEQGDATDLAQAAVRDRVGYGVMPAMSLAMDCASGAGRARREQIAREAARTLLGDAINVPYPEICDGLGVADLGDDFRKPVKSAVPALLISGTLDGRTPPKNAEKVIAGGLSRATHLIIEGAGHSDPLFLSSPEILEAMERFLAGEKVLKTRIELPPVSFLPPRAEPQ